MVKGFAYIIVIISNIYSINGQDRICDSILNETFQATKYDVNKDIISSSWDLLIKCNYDSVDFSIFCGESKDQIIRTFLVD